MWVAGKGGETALGSDQALRREDRRGDPAEAVLGVAQVRGELSGSVDRVMTEGSVYDPDLAALALKQARGDQVEAIFLLRAYRTTLPRLAVTLPIATAKMRVSRRISSCFSSEEHTSELQSLMRTSYAVFCSQKKHKTLH